MILSIGKLIVEVGAIKCKCILFISKRLIPIAAVLFNNTYTQNEVILLTTFS